MRKCSGQYLGKTGFPKDELTNIHGSKTKSTAYLNLANIFTTVEKANLNVPIPQIL